MKIAKKLLAVFMSVTMLLAFSVTALAAEEVQEADHTATVSIQLYGEEAWSTSVTTADIAEHATSSGHIYQVPPYATNALKAYTASDALIAAYLNTYGSYDSSQLDWTWQLNSGSGGHEGWGLYFTVYEGMPSSAGKYYYVGSHEGVDQEGNPVTYYTYYWVGDSWNLYIDGVKTNLYSSWYAFDDVATITFDYAETRSENFETTTYIPGAEPAPNAGI